MQLRRCKDGKFKEHLYEHRIDRNMKVNRDRTMMAINVWSKKDRGIRDVKHEIVKKCHPQGGGISVMCV